MKKYGARFSLYPMADNYIDIILGALERTDTSAVYSATDAISTVYRGPLDSVMDALRGLFINAFSEDVHMAIEGSIYDTVPENVVFPEHVLGEPNMLVDRSFSIKCKLTLSSRNSTLAEGLDFIRNVYSGYSVLFGDLGMDAISYGVKFEGDVVQMFSLLKLIAEEAGKTLEQFDLHFTINCNSPTAE